MQRKWWQGEDSVFGNLASGLIVGAAVLVFAIALTWAWQKDDALLHAQGSLTDRESVLRAQAQMQKAGETRRGISTYFAWREPSQRTWLIITSYEGNDPRHDTVTLVQPDSQHDVCLDYPISVDTDGVGLPERVCKSAAQVAGFLTAR